MKKKFCRDDGMYEIEWEQKGTHEEHLDVYNFKKKERAKEVKELEQKIENLASPRCRSDRIRYKGA